MPVPPLPRSPSTATFSIVFMAQCMTPWISPAAWAGRCAPSLECSTHGFSFSPRRLGLHGSRTTGSGTVAVGRGKSISRCFCWFLSARPPIPGPTTTSWRCRPSSLSPLPSHAHAPTGSSHRAFILWCSTSSPMWLDCPPMRPGCSLRSGWQPPACSGWFLYLIGAASLARNLPERAAQG